MMDRPSSSTNPIFDDPQEANNYVTKLHLFGVQRALHQESEAMREYIGQVAEDARQFQQSTKEQIDLINTNMSTQYNELRTLIINRRSSSTSSHRRSRSSRHTDSTQDSSTPTSNTLRQAARQARHEHRQPLHDKSSQELFDEQENRRRHNQATLEQAQERQRLRQQQQERARQYQEEQDAEANRHAQQRREAQAMEAQRALQDAHRNVAARNRHTRQEEDFLRDEMQERRHQARMQEEAPPQARHEQQYQQEHQLQQERLHPQEQHDMANRQNRERLPNRQGNNDEHRYGKLKFTMPKFSGSIDPEDYLSWALKVDKIFRLHNFDEEKKIAMASLEFQDYVLIWWEQIIERREAKGEPPITTWAQMKEVMRARFVPTHYNRDLFKKLQLLKQGTKSVEEYYKEMEIAMIRANITEDDEQTMARF